MRRITDKKTYKEFIRCELKKQGITGGSKKFLLYFPYNFSEKQILAKHTVLLRKAELYKNTGKKLRFYFYKLRLGKLQNNYSLHIPLNCFSKGFKIVHVGPVLVNPEVVCGENCSLHINTTIAAGGIDNKSPVLGDGIVVGVGAAILGNVKLASYIAVGANSVVTKSFDEENIAIAGAPAKKISDNGSKNWNVKH